MTFASTFNALLFAGLGIAVFVVAFILVGRLLPGNLWQRALVERNLEASIILAAIAVALGWIVAAAVH